MVNAFIKALNDVKKLPRIVVFVPDWDLVKFINFYKPGAKDLFATILDWIMRNVDRAVQSKRDSLHHHKPGSVVESEPKIIWSKMIERVGGEYERALTVHYRFNASLEDQLASRKQHYILDVGKVIVESHYFTARNHLNQDGKHKFWREVDHLIKQFESDKEILKPTRQMAFDYDKKAANFRHNRNHQGRDTPHYKRY